MSAKTKNVREVTHPLLREVEIPISPKFPPLT